jgi:uroporphyrinogen decarboxylase
MLPKERILAAVDRRPVDRLPSDYWGTPEVTEMLMAHFGVSDPIDLWPLLHVDKILDGAKPTYVGPALQTVGADEQIDHWGVMRKAQTYADGRAVYYEFSYFPLAQYDSIDEIERSYTWPSPDWFDYSTLAQEYARHPQYALKSGYMAPFYQLIQLRGLQTALTDLAADPDLVDYIVEHVCSFLYEYHRRIFESTRGLIDFTEVTDDLGSQTGLLISRRMFARHFEKHYARLIGLAKEFGIRVFHHDDGAMAEMIPDLLRLGIDVLNPIQWRLPGMDLAGLKERYGDRLSFHGAIDNQWVLPFGTARDVVQEVELCMSTLGAGGTGYVVAPCHNIQPITPIENIVAMYETVYHSVG